MKEISGTEARQLMLDLLQQVDELCKKHGIRYTLSDGTLIGAVRHKGYIPWDDDIDISMLREDYDKFREGFDTWEHATHLELLDYRKDPNVMFPFFKICDNRTEMQMARNSKRPMGINIDVFPLDGIPGGRWRAALFIRICHLLKQCQSLANQETWHNKKYSPAEVLIRFFFRVLTLGLPVSFFCRLQQWVASYYKGKPCPWTANVTWIISMKRGVGQCCIPTSAYQDDIEMQFEDKVYPCISGYDTYLRCQYGDYMTPPPEQARANVHLFKMWWK